MPFNSAMWDLWYDIKTIEQARKLYQQLIEQIQHMETLAKADGIDLTSEE